MSYTIKLIKELLPIFFLISLSLLSTTGALGQAYPTRPITLVVPYAAGSGLDPLARTIAANLAPRLGQPIVIDFKAGAGSAIGSDFAARSAPNGYTLILTTVALPVLPALYKNLQFDPIKDFTHISKIATGSMALVVNPKQLPVKTLDELVSRAKAQPGKLNYGSAGNATPHHLGMEMFKHELGLDIVHVPYKGATGALNDLLGGQIPMAMFPVNVVLPFVRDGRLTVLAVSGRGRSLLAPDAPSFEELGLKNLDIDVYYFISGPAKLPPEIVGQLNAEIAKTLNEVRTPLLASGLVAERSSPDAITEHIKNDMVRWKDLITKARITAE
jgi:tripartite-type tricarboxylate transporter receptor subunit TctC